MLGINNNNTNRYNRTIDMNFDLSTNGKPVFGQQAYREHADDVLTLKSQFNYATSPNYEAVVNTGNVEDRLLAGLRDNQDD